MEIRRINLTLLIIEISVEEKKNSYIVDLFYLEIIFAGNRIGDVGMENLSKVLDSLPNLSVLDLSCNDITPVGLSHLCAVLTTETKCLQVSLLEDTMKSKNNIVR